MLDDIRCKSESEAFILRNRLSCFTVITNDPQYEFIFTVIIVIRTIYDIKAYPFLCQFSHLDYSHRSILPIVKVRRS